MRRPACLALALLCAACGPTASSRSGSAPAHRVAATPAPAIAGGINAAEADLFANHYAAADSELDRLLTAAPRSPDLHAAYALVLDYGGDAADARAQAAQAVKLDPHSAAAHAALCRVHDWAGELNAAADAGRAAISLDAGNALARLFLGEALADSGDLAGAQAQLDTAQTLIAARPTPYLQAELQRERGNLAADAGRPDDQLAALQRARSLQPGWQYRAEDLAGAQFSAQQYDEARETLDSAAAAPLDDAAALEALGDEAILDGNGPVALTAWQKAAALAPTDARVLDMQGEVQVAVSRDINGAVSAFQRALTLHPDDLVAAAYLTALARYVQGQPELAAAEIGAALQPDVSRQARRQPAPPDPDAAAAAASAQALATVNAVRQQAGLAAVHLDSQLGASAASHAFYWLFNAASPSVAGLGIHSETPGLIGFSGTGPGARAAAVGYPSPRLAEDITHRDTASAAVHDWVDSVYHRFPILRPDLVAIGYGQAQAGRITIQDVELGYAELGSAAPVRYPAPAQSHVPAMFVDNELPDPVPPGKQRTTGYPVTVTFAPGDTVTVSAFTVSGPGGGPLDAYVLAPSASTENSASLLPALPLKAATTYTAHIAASVDGQPYDETWSFTTAP